MHYSRFRYHAQPFSALTDGKLHFGSMKIQLVQNYKREFVNGEIMAKQTPW